MKTILILLAFVLLPLAVGWSAYEVGKGVGKVVEVEKECLACYCEECGLTSLQSLLSNKDFTVKCE